MERLTIEKAGSILVKDLSGGYASPCFGCESIGNCVSKKTKPCAIYRALEKLKEYEDTGLSPGQIIEMDQLYQEKCQELVASQKKAERYHPLHPLEGYTYEGN